MLVDLKPRRVKPAFGSVQVDWGHPLARGLIGCWVLNELGGTIAYDLRGLNNATFVGSPAWTANVVGTLKLNGSSDSLIVSAPVALNPVRVTVAGRFFLGSNASTANAVLEETDSGDAINSKYLLFEEVNKAKFRVNIGGTLFDAVGSTTLTTLTAYTLAGTHDGTTARVFLNGVEEGNIAASGAFSSSVGKVRIATLKGFYPLNGWLDYVMVWDRVLTAGEIVWVTGEPYAFLRANKPQYVLRGTQVATDAPTRTLTGVGR